MKRRVISILLLWVSAYLLTFPLLYWSYQIPHVNGDNTADIVQIISLTLAFAVILVAGIVIGKRLRKDTAITVGRRQIFERLGFALLLWFIYACNNDIQWFFINAIQTIGVTPEVEYFRELHPARIFLYELLVSPFGLLALLFSCATVVLTIGKKSDVSVK